MTMRRTALGLVVVAALAAGGCDSRQAAGPAAAVDFKEGASCSLDGMVLSEYPGPKGQVLYEGGDGPEWFCDTMELLNALLKPEQVRRVRGAWVQDAAAVQWDQPRGGWIDARQAVYVLGSRKKGSMGATAAPFRDAAAAQAFATATGGKVVPFAEITATMVDLSGGALHDSRM